MSGEINLERRGQIEAAVALLLSQLLILGERAPLPIAGPLVPGMLPLLVFSLRWGVGPGTLVCLASGVIRLITRLELFLDWWTYLLEQVLSFTLLGLAGLFRGRKKGALPAVVTALGLRYGLLLLVSCSCHADLAPATFMYITLTSPTLYFTVYHGLALCMNLCLCMAVLTPLLYPLRRFFTGADLAEEPDELVLEVEEEPELRQSGGEEEPEPELFLFRDRYGSAGAPAEGRRTSSAPEWWQVRTDAGGPRREPLPNRSARDSVPPSRSGAGDRSRTDWDREQMWNRARAPEPEQPKKPNPYQQRRERYNPYEWYEKRDRSRMPNGK